MRTFVDRRSALAASLAGITLLGLAGCAHPGFEGANEGSPGHSIACRSQGPSLDTVVIFSRDADRLAEFYRKGLGLEYADQHPGHRGFVVGRCYLGIDDAPQEADGPGPVTIWVTVDDLDAALSRLQGLGAKIKAEPTERAWGARLASVFDPDGNTLGLSQRR